LHYLKGAMRLDHGKDPCMFQFAPVMVSMHCVEVVVLISVFIHLIAEVSGF